MRKFSFFVCFLALFLNANEYSKDENATYNDTAISTLAEQGQILYTQKCASCHGKNAEVIPFGVGQKLSDLSAKEIVNAIRSYKIDTDFGYKYKNIMQLQSNKITEKELKQIVAYLKGNDGDDGFFAIFSPDENTDISTTPSEQGVYIQ